jgi:hypothetical protein
MEEGKTEGRGKEKRVEGGWSRNGRVQVSEGRQKELVQKKKILLESFLGNTELFFLGT